jgi:hypothetical protein
MIRLFKDDQREEKPETSADSVAIFHSHRKISLDSSFLSESELSHLICLYRNILKLLEEIANIVYK